MRCRPADSLKLHLADVQKILSFQEYAVLYEKILNNLQESHQRSIIRDILTGVQFEISKVNHV
jgi:hypothetical protein